MESRARKCSAPATPERPRPRTDPPPNPQPHHQQQQQQQQLGRKIPVVYYLCRNRHLDHPHFIEVPLSRPGGLLLRDVINRLNAVRGNAMPAMYSWSCKRSYKNGFVWHDLGEDDLVIPAGGNEYILKGSELLHSPAPDRPQHSTSNPKSQSQKHLHQEHSSASPPTIVVKESKASTPTTTSNTTIYPVTQEDQLYRPPCGDASPDAVEYRVCHPVGAADASTQTDDVVVRKPHCSAAETRTRGVSTDDGSSELESPRDRWNGIGRSSPLGNLEMERAVEVSPPPTSSSASSSGGKTETLETLIRADVGKTGSFRIVEEELPVHAGPKVKAGNLLMQLITCGSIAVKDHLGLGIVPAYQPRFSHMKFGSPMFVGSVMLGGIDCLSENPKFVGLRMEDKEYFSGSLIETKKQREEVGDGVPVLKRSSSYNADRSCKSPEPKKEKERPVVSSRSRCLPRTAKITSNKQSRNETTRSPLSEGPRNSSAVPDSCLSVSLPSSKDGSKRFANPSSVKGSSMRLESFKQEKEKVIKIEERLTSGAWVIIQSRAPCDDSEDSSSSG